jgi:hypothetical protein
MQKTQRDPEKPQRGSKTQWGRGQASERHPGKSTCPASGQKGHLDRMTHLKQKQYGRNNLVLIPALYKINKMNSYIISKRKKSTNGRKKKGI